MYNIKKTWCYCFRIFILGKKETSGTVAQELIFLSAQYAASKYNTFEEYHTSHDNLEFVSEDGLQ